MINSMMTKNIVIIIPAVFFLWITPQLPSANGNKAKPISSSEEAINRAIEYTGFDEKLTMQKMIAEALSPERALFNDTSYAYGKTYIAGKPLWRVTFKDIVIKYGQDSNEINDSATKTFEVLLDSASGTLVAITSIGQVPDKPVAQLCDLAEVSTPSEMFQEKYSGLPMIAPPVNFKAALKAAKYYPLMAERITAVLIQYSADTSRLPQLKNIPMPFPAWVLYLEGVGPMSVSYTGEPPTNQRRVISALTGACITPAVSYVRSKQQ